MTITDETDYDNVSRRIKVLEQKSNIATLSNDELNEIIDLMTKQFIYDSKFKRVIKKWI